MPHWKMQLIALRASLTLLLRLMLLQLAQQLPLRPIPTHWTLSQWQHPVMLCLLPAAAPMLYPIRQRIDLHPDLHQTIEHNLGVGLQGEQLAGLPLSTGVLRKRRR